MSFTYSLCRIGATLKPFYEGLMPGEKSSLIRLGDRPDF